jgi:hypothetical protein
MHYILLYAVGHLILTFVLLIVGYHTLGVSGIELLMAVGILGLMMASIPC